MKYSAAAYLLTVTIISFLGYCVENIWLAVTQRYIDNRNMYLPFLLGYGLTVVGIYLICGTPRKWLKKRPSNKFLIYFAYFLLMTIIVSIGEIMLGTAVEHFCGFTYWNYAKIPLHFTKYTSVPTSFGFAGIIVFFMEFFMEHILYRVQQIPQTPLRIVAIGFIILLVSDYLISFRSMYYNKRANHLWRYNISQKQFIRYHIL